MKYGEIEVVIQYETHTQNPFEPRAAERIIRLWAIEREERKPSKDFQLAVEAEVRAHFSHYHPDVISVKFLNMEPPPPEILEKPTLADYQIQRLRAKKQAAIALASEDNSDLPDIPFAKRSLKVMVEDDVKSSINDLFNHPDHA